MMKTFLSNLNEPVAAVCYGKGFDGKMVPLDFNALKQKIGTDPFDIPNLADVEGPAIKALRDCRFVAGFKARLGVIENDAFKAIPIVQFQKGISAVDFNMLCSEFTVIGLNGGLYDPITWMRVAQSPDKPWVFNSRVDLSLSIMRQEDRKYLAKDVQERIKEMENLSGSAFSIQQLLFDLAHANLMSVPTIQGVETGSAAHTILMDAFLGEYFAKMQEDGAPLLCCAAATQQPSNSSLILSGFTFAVDQYVGPDHQPVQNPTPEMLQCTTLNYLCATDNHPVLPQAQFKWNWVDVGQVDAFNGAVAINRNTLANYFRLQLDANGFYRPYCVSAWVNCDYHSSSAAVKWDWRFTPCMWPNTIVVPETGSTILSADYTSYDDDQAGINGCLGKIKVRSSYNFRLEVVENTMVATQTQTVWAYLKNMATSAEANIVQRQLVDKYTITVDSSIEGQGNLLVSDPQSTASDTSTNITTDAFQDFWTHLNKMGQDIARDCKKVVPTDLKSIPISNLRSFVFPGGRTFTFTDVTFSAFQDLISGITYAEPTASVVTVPSRTQVLRAASRQKESS